jgi:hypothetical protein
MAFSSRQQSILLGLWGLSFLAGAGGIVALSPSRSAPPQPLLGALLGILAGSTLVIASVGARNRHSDQTRLLSIAGGAVGVGLLLGSPLVLAPWRYEGGLAGGVSVGLTLLMCTVGAIVVCVSVLAYRNDTPRTVLTLFAVIGGLWWFYVFQLDPRFQSTYELELTVLWLLLVGGSVYTARRWRATRI